MSDMTGAVGYAGAHWRMAKLRGPARGYQCVDCPEQAAEWSYVGPPEVTFSTDPAHYQPRCRSCHRKLDIGAGREVHAFRRRGESHPQAKLTTADVAAIRAAIAAGQSQRSLAKRYGVGWQYIGDIKRGKARKYD